MFFVLALLLPAASAEYGDDALISAYAPVMKFNSQETFYPAPVEYGIQSSVVKQSGGSIVENGPTASSIASYPGDSYYLDNSRGWVQEIAADYQQRMGSLTPTIYAHVARNGQYTAIQYWFYYAFNPGPINNHEGDWETITILINVQGIPEWAAYSQHESGERVPWGEVEVAQGTHPIVYVGRGSHANYFRGYEGKVGLANDDVGGDGISLSPAALGGNLQVISLDSGSTPWLSFGGRWGDISTGQMAGVTGSNGPYGPSAGDHASRYASPSSWAMSIPQGGGGSFTLNWLVANFFLFFMIYLIIRVAIKAIGIVRGMQKGELQIKRLITSSFAVWLIIGLIGTILVLIGTMTTWYAVSGDIQSAEVSTQGKVDLISFSGMDGLRVNTLQKGAGMTGLFGFLIPFGLVLVANIIFTIMDLIGAKSGKKLGLKYLLGGIMPIVTFIMIIAVIGSLGGLVPQVTQMASQAGGSVPQDAAALLTSVSSSAFSGGYQGPFGGYSSVSLSWGMGIGAWLMLIGGIIKIVAGVIMIAAAPKDVPAVKAKVVQAAQFPYATQQVQYVYQQPVQPHQYIPPQQKSCRVCGRVNQPVDTFCQNCGTRL